jgi:hypothetical protein
VGSNTPGFTKRDFPIVLSPAAKKEEPTPAIDPVDDALDAVGEQTALPVGRKIKSKTK